MATLNLKDRSILVAEDEPLVAADIVASFEEAGAVVLVARQKREALMLAERPDLDAAVLDWTLAGGDVGPVCKRLDYLAVPYVVYSGLSEKPAGCSGVFVSKPAPSERLISAIAELLTARVY